MKLVIVAAMVVVSCCSQLVSSVPIEPKDEKEISAEKSEDDPCNLEELENLPDCIDDDTKCRVSNSLKRLKRQTLCEQNANCSFCSPFLDDFAEPEIVQPIFITNNRSENSTDDESPPAELREQPVKLIERNIIIENDNETQYYRGYIESGANITTIIRLTNLINNTNIVNMPTTLNNTNINNIHVYQNKTSNEGGKFGLGYNERGPCCFAVQPKNCKQSTAGTKCLHKRRRVCGRQCTSKVIHPNRNPCTNTPQWPYVNCPPQNQFPGFNPGFNQPGFYPPQFYPPGYPGFYPQTPPQDDEFDDDDDFPLFPEEEVLEDPESGWVVGSDKCKVVSEDGLRIFNCTQKGVEFENPFAKNTIKRNVRHAVYPGGQVPNPMQPQMVPQQMQYYPMPYYQPIYIQPMPVLVPQYYAQPPPMNYYQPQQMELPPVDDQEAYFENDIETNEVAKHPKVKKIAKKHRPVVIEDDDEL